MLDTIRSIKYFTFAFIIILSLSLGSVAVMAQTGLESTHTSSAIDVDGVSVDIEGYNINGNNYFKLRDIAASLKATQKNFQVEYDIENDRVIITPGTDYEPDGSETYVPENPTVSKVVPTISEVYFADERLELKAYNVNGYNFVKLRDVAEMMDFALMYYDETKSVSFITEKDYSESEEFYPEKPENEDYVDPSGSFAFKYLNEYSKYFVNYVDGYQIMVPVQTEADMSISEFRALLKNEDMNIEIYRQNLSASGGYNSYVNYGNKFIDDSSVYTKLKSYNTTVGGYKTYVLEWYRKPLSRVENDKCYYASIDIKLSEAEALTLLFKSSKPFDEANETKAYMNIVNTLSFTERTAKGAVVKSNTLENTKWNEQTKEIYKKYFSPESKLVWGIFEPSAPLNFDSLKRIENTVGEEFDFLIYYTNVNTNLHNLSLALSNAEEESRVVELTLQTVANKSGNGNMLMDVLDGKHDVFLNQYAKIVAESEAPVLFRLCNEMNGDWCVYSAYHTSKDTQLYQEFYRYIYDIFSANGADKNTIWVWNPNERSFPYYDWNHALCYYPGDEYVDVIGLTGYNNGTYYSGEIWRSFESIYNSFYYQYLAWFSQPMMITEFACSSYGGDKAQWVRDMFLKLKDYDKLKVAIWWNGCDYDASGRIARPYFIDDNPEVLEAFKEYFEENPR